MALGLKVVGEPWSLLILRDTPGAGSSRFRDSRRTIDIATNVLVASLEGFVAGGLMKRRSREGRPGDV